MRMRLPPLNALRALEAAGRHMSFSRAADELCVTAGAVSRQIRGLEELLGFSLFERHHREVRLTPESKIYIDSLTDAFSEMERSTRRLVDSRKLNYLHVHCAITFTLCWLVPRLVNFHQRHPTREVRMSTGLPGAVELGALPTDVSIQIRNEEICASLAPAILSHPLVDVDLVPVCSPSLIAENGLGDDPARWGQVTRLISSARPNDWQEWVTAANVDVDPQAGIVFQSSSLAYQAAIQGMGVALAMKGLVKKELASGELVVAHPLVHVTGTAFYLLYSQAAAIMPQIKEFRDWIVAEAAHPRAR
ncbi:LysR substrate-binding domain-containing protein [Bosea sp. BK604]|uniref:LysR substrate-binding domain-containing protein n=1 Tax=Bosea sp. BK604 TaxID=2512180 RepID=UPI00104CF17E|nr:LysR substrate-binding domain-containing protein [Bosea sp. BK604]TCR70652.1 LysR family transcriptional regulator [Bosea sp. BK604]